MPSDGVDLDSGTPASLSISLLGSGGVAGGVWWRSLSGGTVALGFGLGFGGALRGRGGFFLGCAWAFFWVRSRARRHVASASRLRSARRSLSASASRSA